MVLIFKEPHEVGRKVMSCLPQPWRLTNILEKWARGKTRKKFRIQNECPLEINGYNHLCKKFNHGGKAQIKKEPCSLNKDSSSQGWQKAGSGSSDSHFGEQYGGSLKKTERNTTWPSNRLYHLAPKIIAYTLSWDPGWAPKIINESLQCSLVAQRLKCLPVMRETRVRSLGWEDPLEKEMETYSSTLAWKIPWTVAGYSPWGCKELDTTEQLRHG